MQVIHGEITEMSMDFVQQLMSEAAMYTTICFCVFYICFLLAFARIVIEH